MPTETTRPIADDPQLDATLHLAYDLGNTEWTFSCAPAVAVAPRESTDRITSQVFAVDHTIHRRPG